MGTIKTIDIAGLEQRVSLEVWSVIQDMTAKDSWAINNEAGSNEVMLAIDALIKCIVHSPQGSSSLKLKRLVIESSGWLSSDICIAILSHLSERRPEVLTVLKGSVGNDAVEVVLQRIIHIEKVSGIMMMFSPTAIQSVLTGIRDYKSRVIG